MPTESVDSPFAMNQPMPKTPQVAPKQTTSPSLPMTPDADLATDESTEPNRAWLWVVSLFALIAIGAGVHKRRKFYFA